MKNMKRISLLWPKNYVRDNKDIIKLSDQTIKDLNCEMLLKSIFGKRQIQDTNSEILFSLCCNEDVITYRQLILKDFIENQELLDCFSELLPSFEAMSSYSDKSNTKVTSLVSLINRISELEIYTNTIDELKRLSKTLHNRGITKFNSNFFSDIFTEVSNISKQDEYQKLILVLPELRKKIDSISSITVGINLCQNLKPAEATLLSVNTQRFSGKKEGLFAKMFNNNEYCGIAPLHHPPYKVNKTGAIAIPLDPTIYGYAIDPILTPLGKDLSKVVSKITKPIEKAVNKYISTQTAFLTDLSHELQFYIKAITFIRDLESKGLHFCFPEVLPKSERKCHIKDSFNIDLAIMKNYNFDTSLDNTIITNDIHFDDKGRIHIITGPNRGGKTVQTQAIGLNQILFQAGLMVPGIEAEMSPVDTIMTHYQIEEQPDCNTGRFGDEAQRFHTIFNHVSQHSLILMNESLSSTSSGESLYIAKDIILAFAKIGSRVVFATHLHELAEKTDELNKQSSGLSTIISMVSQVMITENNGSIKYKNTFKIIPGPSEGHSYAKNIAHEYGISYQQILELLKNRQVL